jgi:hypothetical protein
MSRPSARAGAHEKKRDEKTSLSLSRLRSLSSRGRARVVVRDFIIASARSTDTSTRRAVTRDA